MNYLNKVILRNISDVQYYSLIEGESHNIRPISEIYFSISVMLNITDIP